MRLRLTALSLTLLASPVMAQGQRGGWQAIAYSASTGQDGYAFHFDTKAAAERAALKACREGQGASDCAIADAEQGCLVLTARPAGGVAVKDVGSGHSPAANATSITDANGVASPILRNVCAEQVRKLSAK